MTRSALAKALSDMANPICLVVLRLITKFTLRRLFDRQVGGLGRFKDLIHVSRPAESVRLTHSTRHDRSRNDFQRFSLIVQWYELVAS
jgi:hypothetical protein